MARSVQYIVITPVRDEAAYVEKTLQAVVSQTIRPKQWVIVDDGSTDGTDRLLDEKTKDIPWISVVHRQNRGFRAAGGGVVQAFYAGYDCLDDDQWDYVVKLDADLSFAPDFFERCFKCFDDDPALGIGGGLVCKIEDGETKVDSLGDPPFHVRGATKIYRRACWDKLHPLLAAPGWDTIDEVKANMLGWTTRTFNEIELIQHKPTGGADGNWRNWVKNGKANYITGYHPLFMLAKCAKRAFKKPYFVESFALLYGFCSSFLKQIPRFPEPDVINYLQDQQLKRLLSKPSIYRK